MNTRLSYQMDAELARVRKAGSLDAIQYRTLHSEIVAFGRNEINTLSSTLQTIYDAVEAAYTSARGTTEAAPDAISVDRDALLQTVRVLQQELTSGSIDRIEFDRLNRERQNYFGLLGNSSCTIPANASIVPYYQRAREGLPEFLDNSMDTLLSRDAKTDGCHSLANENTGVPHSTDTKNTEVPHPTIEAGEVDKIAEQTKKSSETGIGWDSSKLRWRFRKRIDGKQKTLAIAPTHSEIVFLKREWEQEQR